MGMAAILVMWPRLFIYILIPLLYKCLTQNLALIGRAVSEKKMFEYYGNIQIYCILYVSYKIWHGFAKRFQRRSLKMVDDDGRTDDGWTPGACLSYKLTCEPSAKNETKLKCFFIYMDYYKLHVNCSLIQRDATWQKV